MASSLILKHKPQAAAEDTTAFGPIAERFRRAGDLERAISLCREGLQKFPQHISARVTLGWALLDLRKYDEARTELEQVLRRTPDNLAAIRGLAELHDRSEDTLHLPMDGPGQWPPDAAAVDLASTVQGTCVVPALASDPDADPVVLNAGEGPELESESSQYGPAVFTPAELGLAVWSSMPPAEPVAPPVALIDPLTAPPPAIHLESVAEPETVGPPVVPEADIAALIAEADSLEAAAESEVAEPALVLDAGVELGGLDDVALDLQSGLTPAHIAEVVSLARAAAAEPVRSPVAALERLLERVHARRRQLMTESVT